MKCIKYLLVAAMACALTVGVASAQPKAEKKQTCCEKAFAQKKECRNKCCVAAHRQNKSCEKCNPGKEDLAILKKKQKKQD